MLLMAAAIPAETISATTAAEVANVSALSSSEKMAENALTSAKMVAAGIAAVSLQVAELVLVLFLVHLSAYGRNPFENIIIPIRYIRFCFNRSCWIIRPNDEFSLLFS
jgi:hypothetical protein